MLRKWNAAELAQHYDQKVLWSHSYFISTVGDADLESVRAYLARHTRPE